MDLPKTLRTTGDVEQRARGEAAVSTSVGAAAAALADRNLPFAGNRLTGLARAWMRKLPPLATGEPTAAPGAATAAQAGRAGGMLAQYRATLPVTRSGAVAGIAHRTRRLGDGRVFTGPPAAPRG